MKVFFFLACFFAMTISMSAQKMAHDHYTVSGGLLGALNYDKFRIDGDNAGDIGYKSHIGWSAGGWVNLPLGNVISLEPQVMYSYYEYGSVSGNALLPYGSLNYISIPVLFKFNLGGDFAFTLGPQIDLLSSLKGTPANLTKDDFASTSLSVSGGFELLPHAPVSIFGRYIHGLTNMDEKGFSSDAEYFNHNIQVGVKVKLFGKIIPADTDGDGIADVDDKCPTVFGLAKFEGCPDTDNDGVTDANDLCPTVAGFERYNGCPIPDTDNDGINDESDKCPKVAGVAKYNGCPIPDTDNDGINDDNDKCPNVAGVAKYGGCPVPDTDGDGINDDLDKCPNKAGVAKYDGCPVPDRDNDGVVDEKDDCPDIAGPVDNDGCPRVENAVFNTRMIQFITGSAVLTKQAKKDIKEGAKLLNSAAFVALKVEIQGHTDSDGSVDYNHTLSHKRAESVKAELAKDGVDANRMTINGYGEDRPIADNATAAGKAKNRRVELKVKQ
ncbi:MAG: OmpA family protein [Saprospiraceae bacterium]|uniref:OmpA family protein n=1 Tax=Candidatus Opimibacter skivensis TaxID=2982028 RepID=A0A9D7SRR6_9BACT|nr:OmpA family protein [Candidatus Opimibacter skivensis]